LASPASAELLVAVAGLVPVLALGLLEVLELQAASSATAAITALGAIAAFHLCVIALCLHPNAHARMRER